MKKAIGNNVVELSERLQNDFHDKFSDKPEIYQVIYENGRARNNALMNLHTASMSRSTTFTGIMIVLATGLLGFLANSISGFVDKTCSGSCTFSQTYDGLLDNSLIMAGVSIFIVFMVSAYMGAKAADPTSLSVVGYRPAPAMQAFVDIQEDLSKEDVLEADYVNLDDSIKLMEAVLNEKNGYLNSAISLAVKGVILAPLVFVFVYLTDFRYWFGI